MKNLKNVNHKVDVCVIGGGIAGICAALSAARNGVSVALIHDRPVLGGASSSENRVHICGADRHNQIPNMRETGIVEELRLENLRKNPFKNYYIWDTILYEKVRFEPNIKLFLNATCMDAKNIGNKIKEITAWQLTTQTFHHVEAKIFIDCSGDAILAPLTGALWTMGRESSSKYNESLADKKGNKYTMGMTCLFQAIDIGKPVVFEPPKWAYKYPNENDLPYGLNGHKHIEMGYWWIELGGMDNCIDNAEKIKDELLKIVFGVWDHIKNYCINKEVAKNWAIDWIQFLPTKRESRRYIGDYVLTQNDILAEGKFHDIVAYGGWTMDDHNSGGFNSKEYKKQPTIFHKTPSPYGIPYRILYSKNISNLMFAGRCISVSHMALSSTRVQATCGVIGQAVGTASAIAVKNNLTPREVGRKKIKELQQLLLADDCYLPWIKQEFSPLTKNAKLRASAGNPEPLRDGISRPVGSNNHRWDCKIGDFVEYIFNRVTKVKKVTIVFDSALSKLIQLSHHQIDNQLTSPPPELVKEFHIDIYNGKRWKTIFIEKDNYQRLRKIIINRKILGIRLYLDKTWGSIKTAVYAFYLD